MKNIEIVKIIDRIEGEVDFVKITNDDGSITTMTKEIYEAQQVAQATLASELSNPSTPQAGE